MMAELCPLFLALTFPSLPSLKNDFVMEIGVTPIPLITWARKFRESFEKCLTRVFAIYHKDTFPC